MSSSHTPNYQLSQWVRSDKVLMEDFNTDNAKIDAALKAEADVRSAAVSALEQKVNAVPLQRFASGTYTGNGQASRLISLGFRPVIVFVWEGTGMVSCLADGHRIHRPLCGRLRRALLRDQYQWSVLLLRRSGLTKAPPRHCGAGVAFWLVRTLRTISLQQTCQPGRSRRGRHRTP